MAPAALGEPVIDTAHCRAYDAVAGEMTWEQARTAAAASVFAGVHGHLATITSAEESAFLAAAFGGRDSYALGGIQTGGPEPAGGWTWITGEPWVYTNWNEGEPNNALIDGEFENRLAWFSVGPRWNDTAANVDEPGPNGYHMGGYFVEYELSQPTIQQQPTAASACPTTSAAFSIQATTGSSVTYVWQIETAPGVWQALGNDPGPLPPPCGGNAFAFPVNSPSVSIGVHGSSCGGPFRIRCVVTDACGSVTSEPTQLFIDAADLGRAGGLVGRDGLHDNNDFIAFISLFFSADVRADIGRAGGLLGSDALFDNNDFIAFINLFFTGC